MPTRRYSPRGTDPTRVKKVLQTTSPFGPEEPAWVIYSPQAKGFRKEERHHWRGSKRRGDGQRILMRQAKARAQRRGEPIEEAMEAVLDTEAGKQLMELRDGLHSEEGVEEAQVDAARKRAKERAESSADARRAPGHPAHG